MFEERIAKILQIVNERNTASVATLAAEIGTSESPRYYRARQKRTA